MGERFVEVTVLAITLAAWVLVGYLVAFLPVTADTQAAFYACGFVALAGTYAMMLELYYARAEGVELRPRALAMLGGGMRFAIAAEFALWLQSLRMLTAAYLVFIVAAFFFVELLFHKALGAQRGRAR